MLDLLSVIKRNAEFTNAVTAMRERFVRDENTPADLERVNEALDALCEAMGREIEGKLVFTTAEVVRPVFGKRRPRLMTAGDDDGPRAETSNGIQTTNEVALEPDTVGALVEYLERLKRDLEEFQRSITDV